jgi:hypothetical protein
MSALAAKEAEAAALKAKLGALDSEISALKVQSEAEAAEEAAKNKSMLFSASTMKVLGKHLLPDGDVAALVETEADAVRTNAYRLLQENPALVAAIKEQGSGGDGVAEVESKVASAEAEAASVKTQISSVEAELAALQQKEAADAARFDGRLFSRDATARMEKYGVLEGGGQGQDAHDKGLLALGARAAELLRPTALQAFESVKTPPAGLYASRAQMASAAAEEAAPPARLLLLAGPVGSGCSSQAQRLAANVDLKVVHVFAGNLLSEAAAMAGSEHSCRIKAAVAAGCPIPADILPQLLIRELNKDK